MHGTIDPAVQDLADHDLGVLLTRCAQGDQLAFPALYDAAVGRLYGLSLKVLHDPGRAEEVTEASFMEVWRCASRFQPAKGTAQAWMSTIAHRRAVACVRSAPAGSVRDATTPGLHGAPGEGQPTGEPVGRDEGEGVSAPLSSLTPLQRQTIELAYFDGFTYPEVASALQIPPGTARSCIRDGLTRLRAERPSPA